MCVCPSCPSHYHGHHSHTVHITTTTHTVKAEYALSVSLPTAQYASACLTFSATAKVGTVTVGLWTKKTYTGLSTTLGNLDFSGINGPSTQKTIAVSFTFPDNTYLVACILYCLVLFCFVLFLYLLVVTNYLLAFHFLLCLLIFCVFV